MEQNIEENYEEIEETEKIEFYPDLELKLTKLPSLNKTMSHQRASSAENVSTPIGNQEQLNTTCNDFKMYDQYQEEQKSIQEIQQMKNKKGVSVYVRFRPDIQDAERKKQQKKCIQINENKESVVLEGKNSNYKFSFAQVFSEDDGQEYVFDITCHSLLENLLEGYNVAILVYGQSGSGKTYTILGDGYDNAQNIIQGNKEKRGIVPRLMEALFHKLYVENYNQITYDISASYLEIYLEKVRDLLFPEKKNIQILQEAQTGLMVSDATSVPITNLKDILNVIQQGSKIRKIARTDLNEFSSRSHAIIIITLFIVDHKTGIKKASQLYLADLAGSESVAKSNAEGERVREAGKINQSLLSLGNVIKALVDKKKYVGYRDSKLTRIMQNSFGGNSYSNFIFVIQFKLNQLL